MADPSALFWWRLTDINQTASVLGQVALRSFLNFLLLFLCIAGGWLPQAAFPRTWSWLLDGSASGGSVGRLGSRRKGEAESPALGSSIVPGPGE